MVQALVGTNGVTVSERAAETLRSAVEGAVLRPGDDGFEQARRIWNGMIDRVPGLIVRCASPSDVQRCVAFARDHELLVAVKGGGHSFSGKSVCDGGLMIDLSGLRRVAVDPSARTAKVDPGVLWSELDAATGRYGLAVPGGSVSHTGVAGLTLGGGFGWLARRFGLTLDNLIAADVVTADGVLRRASDRENPDLFWGLRGGGGNFGVVTSFEFRLHPLGMVYAGLIAHPLSTAPTTGRLLRDLAAGAPDELGLAGVFATTPDGHPVIGAGLCYAGPADEAERVIAPIRTSNPQMRSLLGPMSYPAAQAMIDETAPYGLRYYLRSHMLDELSDELIDTLAERYAHVPSPLSLIFLFQLGGAISRIPPEATAYAHRQAAFVATISSGWADPADDAVNIEWAKQTSDAMRRFTSGAVYVNQLGDEGEDRVRAAYGAPTYARLAALKRRYDPTNLFRLNQNIKPPA